MNRARFAIILLLTIAPATLAQDDPPAKPAAIELMALYTQAGRSWTHRIIHSMRGESPDVETSTTRITKLEAGIAQCVIDTESADRTRFSSSRFKVDTSDVPEDAKAWAGADLPLETLDMGFRKFACKKHVVNDETAQNTTWVSIEYHPLIVKQVTFEVSATSIRKLTAFIAGDVDPWLLYRKEGRRWKTKMTMTAGAKPMVNFTEYTVKEAREDSATYTMTMQDGAGKVMMTQDMEMKFSAPSAAGNGATSAKMTMEQKTCEVGEFECYLFDTNGTKSWSSVHWPGLMVAISGNNLEVELVEFELGHDPYAFYRTAGNYYVVTTTSKFGGGQSETKVRTEVKSVEELDVKWLQIYTDNRGKEIFRQENKLALPEAAEPAVYAGEIEEMVDTPAGRLPAIRSDIDLDGQGSYVTWTWNGIIIKTEQRMEGIDVTAELTELNLQ